MKRLRMQGENETGASAQVLMNVRDDGTLPVAPQESGSSLTQSITRYYTGDPGTTVRIRSFDRGVEKVTVVVEGVEPAAGAAEPAVRVAFNMTAAMGAVALADRDPGENGDLPYWVATLDKPLVITFDPTDSRIWNVVFIEDNTTAITGVRIIGEYDEE